MNFKKIIYIFLGLLIAVGILVGGHKLQEKRDYDQMVEIVESKEVKQLIEKDIRFYDKNAFKQAGLIKYYKIDKDTIEQNPMGGVNFTIIINDDDKLTIEYNIDKGVNEQTAIGSKVLSADLSDYLRKE